MKNIRYVWGVDLGEVRDPTAVAVISREYRQRTWWYVLGGLWQPSPDDVAQFRRPGADFYEGLQGWLCNHFDTREPRGARIQYAGNSALGLDGTGPGRDATVRFLRGRLSQVVRMVPFLIRPGDRVNSKQGENGFLSVTRKDLIVTLESVRDSGRLAYVEGLELESALNKELENFRIKETPDDGLTRNDHDDLAVALAIAVTLAERMAGVGPGGLVSVRYE